VAGTPAFVLAGVAGAASPFDLLWVADATGAVLPTTATAALDTTFKPMGLVTQDGANVSTDVNTEDISAFGSFNPVRTLITSEKRTVKVTALETNKITAAIRARLGLTGVTVTTGAFPLTLGPGRDALYALCIDMADGSSNRQRRVLPSVRLTALDDQQISYGNPVQYGFTFTAYPDSSGVSIYEYDVVTGLT
jgi:hypothetical protein